MVRVRSGLLATRDLCDWFILFIHNTNSFLDLGMFRLIHYSIMVTLVLSEGSNFIFII